ncbi:MAG: D-glycero-beta-D-manno-heptose 1-phosphate adenylyltransferase [Candidatus Electrothrix sp. GM3_4]|nr:D-glycero-beta-D-manno-heptose 1-phosphate adenylyltransferase [Candidatus Electrothrix sp. GM3_4]
MEQVFPQVACLQMSLQQGDVDANLKEFQRMLAAASFAPDTLVVLPELWATGFDYANIDTLAEQTPEILAELQQKSAQSGIWFAGSLLDKQEAQKNQKIGGIYNSLFVVGPEGIVGRYQKQHLFKLWQEDQYLITGKESQAVLTPFGPIGALVCYDLRFPELSRRQVFSGCTLLIVSAQWPAVRSDHWEILLRARAVENQAFVVACNGSGNISVGDLAGHSMIIAPSGKVLAEADEKPSVIRAELDAADVEAARSRFCSAAERPWYGQDCDKMVTLEILLERLPRMRTQGSKVVFTNGCFDILHAGHVSYLEEARRCGDCLVIGLNSDRSVQALKGPSRPVNSELERARVLAALGCVDFVVLFDEDTPLKLITTLLPDILVKGADWPEDQIAGAAEVKAAKGKIVRIAFTCQTSTTGIIDKIYTFSRD